jgi:two-component system LytT family response regulator
MVPRLILQPLVENAVRHGISRRTGPGRIEVHAWLSGGQLKMTVMNDGAGWMERATPGGLGLANTRARLAQHFADRYQFVLREGGEGGAVAEVEIPFRRWDDADRTQSSMMNPWPGAPAFLRPEAGGNRRRVRNRRSRPLSMQPQLVFLDVQMPGMDGLPCKRSNQSLVVFVTAHDQYAVQAFEKRAIDYLLKPFSKRRFEDAVSRVRERIEGPDSGDLKERMARLLRTVAGPKTHLVVKTGTHSMLLQTIRIEWLEAEGDYVRVHAGREVYLTRQTMNRIESELGAGRFVRVHRSAIVNVEFIKEIHSLPGGDHVVTLRALYSVQPHRRLR